MGEATRRRRRPTSAAMRVVWVGEVFLASPTPQIDAQRAHDLAEHESRHVDQWAVATIVGGITLLPALYLVDDSIFPKSENHFEKAAGLDDGGYPPPPDPPDGPRLWAVALWAGVLLLIIRRRIRWLVRVVVLRRRGQQEGRCAVHTTGWMSPAHPRRPVVAP